MGDMQPNQNGQALAGAIGGLMEAIRAGRYPWWYPKEARGLQIDYFVIGTDFTPLAASATTGNPVQITGESAFCALSGVLVETDTANTTFLAQRPLLADIRDSGSNRLLSNTPIHVDNWYGTAELPKYWDVPKIFAPAGTVVFTLQNLEATARNVRLALHGFKIFGYGPGGGR